MISEEQKEQMEVDQQEKQVEEEVKLIETEVDKKLEDTAEPKSEMLDLIRNYITADDKKSF